MAADQLDQLDYYTLLGVEPDATTDDIKLAFRKFALRYHPDRHVERGPEAVARATAIYRRGSEALDTLTHPAQRSAYDIGLKQGQLRLQSDARNAPIKGKREIIADRRTTLCTQHRWQEARGHSLVLHAQIRASSRTHRTA